MNRLLGLTWGESYRCHVIRLRLRAFFGISALVAVSCSVSREIAWRLSVNDAVAFIEREGGTVRRARVSRFIWCASLAVELKFHGERCTDAALNVVSRLDSLREVDVSRSMIGDDGLRCLSRLPELKSLDIRRTFVSDDGIALLGQCDELVDLRIGAWLEDLFEPPLTGHGLRHLREIDTLQRIVLEGGTFGDEVVEHLCQIKSLKYVELIDTNLSHTGINRLRQRVPKVVAVGVPLEVE